MASFRSLITIYWIRAVGWTGPPGDPNTRLTVFEPRSVNDHSAEIEIEVDGSGGLS
jgi:hypothetical protein